MARGRMKTRALRACVSVAKIGPGAEGWLTSSRELHLQYLVPAVLPAFWSLRFGVHCQTCISDQMTFTACSWTSNGSQ